MRQDVARRYMTTPCETRRDLVRSVSSNYSACRWSQQRHDSQQSQQGQQIQPIQRSQQSQQSHLRRHSYYFYHPRRSGSVNRCCLSGTCHTEPVVFFAQRLTGRSFILSFQTTNFNFTHPLLVFYRSVFFGAFPSPYSFVFFPFFCLFPPSCSANASIVHTLKIYVYMSDTSMHTAGGWEGLAGGKINNP